MTTDDLPAISRYLSYLLRHNPGAVGLSLDRAGWVDIGTLLAATAASGRPIQRADLERLAEPDSAGKRRFEFSEGRIRAAQGHSIPVDLDLEPAEPPPVLYHGTVDRFLASIRVTGLLSRGRHHVHLSATRQAAAAVGARRGRPVVLPIDAAGMRGAGAVFYRASNGVWLTSHVPPEWIRFPNSESGVDRDTRNS